MFKTIVILLVYIVVTIIICIILRVLITKDLFLMFLRNIFSKLFFSLIQESSYNSGNYFSSLSRLLKEMRSFLLFFLDLRTLRIGAIFQSHPS